MIIADYSDRGLGSLLEVLDDNYPFVFQKEYAFFSKEELSSRLIFLISDSRRIFMPARLYKKRIFSFAQILHPPLKETKRLSPEEERGFLDEAVGLIKEKRICQRIVQPPNYAIFQAFPEDSVHCCFGTYFLDLQGRPEEDLFACLNNRTEIRHAQKEGVVIKHGKAQLAAFYGLYSQTMKRTGMFFEPLAYFEKYYSCLGEGRIFCAVAYHHDVPQGAAFLPYTKYAAYYLYGASAEHVSINGAIDYLHWEAIKSMKEKGVRRYDFVGARLSDIANTRLEGIQHFKAKFGSQLEEGYLWKADIHKGYSRLFDMMLRLKLALKGKAAPKDIIEQELAAFRKAGK